MSIKTCIQLGVIFLLIGGATFFLNTRQIVKKSTIKAYEINAERSVEAIAKLDSTIYSLQQDVDMKQKTDKEFQIVIRDLSNENKELKNKVIQSSMLVDKIEANGNVRYFEKTFLQKCFKETFKKPDCIKQ